MFIYKKKTPSEGTFKARITDYKVKNSSWDSSLNLVTFNQYGEEINLVKRLPERYKTSVSIRDFEVLIPPSKANLEAKETSNFLVWLYPTEIEKLIKCHASGGHLIFEAGITHHLGILTFVRIRDYDYL